MPGWRAVWTCFTWRAITPFLVTFALNGVCQLMTARFVWKIAGKVGLNRKILMYSNGKQKKGEDKAITPHCAVLL